MIRKKSVFICQIRFIRVSKKLSNALQEKIRVNPSNPCHPCFQKVIRCNKEKNPCSSVTHRLRHRDRIFFYQPQDTPR
jgi:hypothetical protein